MSEHAIKIEGFDEFTHLPVRIQHFRHSELTPSQTQMWGGGARHGDVVQ